jgi:hypothetical protein
MAKPNTHKVKRQSWKVLATHSNFVTKGARISLVYSYHKSA